MFVCSLNLCVLWRFFLCVSVICLLCCSVLMMNVYFFSVMFMCLIVCCGVGLWLM